MQPPMGGFSDDPRPEVMCESLLPLSDQRRTITHLAVSVYAEASLRRRTPYALPAARLSDGRLPSGTSVFVPGYTLPPISSQ